MSYYDQWFLTNQQPDSPGKRKRDDFYSDGGKYASDYTEGGGQSSYRGGGVSSYRGGGASSYRGGGVNSYRGGGSSSYRGGAGGSYSYRGDAGGSSSYRGGAGGSSTYGGGAGGSVRGSYGGNRGGRGRGGYPTTNYSDFQHGSPSWQGYSNQPYSKNFVSKKQRMMDEIAQLEDDTEELMLQERLRALREEKSMREIALNKPYPGQSSMGRGGYGRGRGFGREIDDFGWGYGAGSYRGRGGGYHPGRGSGYFNRGRGGPGQRYRKKDTKTEGKKEREREENNPYEYKLETKDEIDMEGRDERLLTLMKLMKSFDARSTPAQTLRHCIRNNNLNIQVFYCKNTSALYLDQLYLARGSYRNNKSDTYTQAMNKLRTLSLDEIKADAENAGEYKTYPDKRQYPIHTFEEVRKMTTPIEIAEFPFRRRLELFCIAINRHSPKVHCTKLYCTKYAMNLRSVYTFHPEEEENRQHIRIYLCEMFVCEAIGKDRSKCDKQCITNFYETLKTKTIDEMMENDGRYSKDVFKPPISIQYKGVGHQEEDNLCRLASLGPGTLDTIEKNSVDDLVIIDKKSYDGSWSKIIEETALYNRLKLTYVWDLVHPGGELPEIGTEKKMQFEIDLIREGRISGKKVKKSNRKDEVNLEEDKVFADTNDIDDIEKHKEAVAKRAREYRVLMISCKVYLQDKFVGEGYSIYRRCAHQVASVITYKNLFSKHTAIFHHDDKDENEDYDYQLILKRAEELREELPEPPVFEDYNPLNSSVGTDLPVEKHDNDKDHDDNGDKSDEDNQSDDDVVIKMETDDQDNGTAKGKDKSKETTECNTSEKTIYLHDKEEELLPWIKEVIKRDIEKLSQSAVLWKKHVVYRGHPVHMQNFIKFCSKKYGLDIRSKMDKGVREEYTTSVQSFKPVLDSYKTSTNSIDRTNNQPDSYRTATTASAFDSQLSVNSKPHPNLSLYSQDRPFQQNSIDKAKNQKNEKSNFMSNKNWRSNQHSKNQRGLQDCELDFEFDQDFCDYPVPRYRRHPPRFNPPRYSERMPKLPSRRYSSPPFYESHQQDLSDHCDDFQSNYPRQNRDMASSRHHNGSTRYSPLHSRGCLDNIRRRHSLRGRHETRPSFSSFEANDDFNCDPRLF